MFKIFEQQFVRYADGSVYDVAYDLRYKSRDERQALAEAKRLASEAIKHYPEKDVIIEVFELDNNVGENCIRCDVRVAELRANIRYPIHSFFIERVPDNGQC